MQQDLAIVLTTVSDDEQAEALADILVQSDYTALMIKILQLAMQVIKKS